MKKVILIAAAFVAFAACSKVEKPVNQDSNEGTKVILLVNAESNPATKVNGTLNGEGKIAFTWESTDKIKVTRGGESAEFTYVSGEGTSAATFEGVMPGTEGPFDVQFPATDTDLPLTQEYVENGLPHNLMKAVATNCTLTDDITLTPVYSALRLNLYCEDYEAITIGKIVITTTEEPARVYTLTCPSAVTLGTSSEVATPFFLVMPACTTKFKVDIYDTPSTTVLCNSFSTTKAQAFNAGKVRNMPVQKMKIHYYENGADFGLAVKFGDKWWAPVNCGYRLPSNSTEYFYEWGLYYQWGRGKGLPYPEDNIVRSASFTGTNGTEDPNTFYEEGSTAFFGDWISLGSHWYWNGDPNNTQSKPVKGSFDPCPNGWRIPSMDEMDILFENSTIEEYSRTQKSLIFYNGHTEAIGLPYAGLLWYGGLLSGLEYHERNNNGYYWTSTIYDTGEKSYGKWECFSQYLVINSADYESYFFPECRHYACSVRCIKE